MSCVSMPCKPARPGLPCKLLVLCISGLFLAHYSNAQDTTLTATVTHIAGPHVYLNIGTADGITKGDTLHITGERSFLGRVIVESAASRQTVVAFADNSFSITRGTKLTVIFSKMPVRAEPVQSSEAVEEDAVSQTNPLPQTARRTPSKRRDIKIRGRVLLNFSVLNSETKPQAEGLPSTKRTFFTPSINLNTTVSNLPSDVKLRLNIRSDYRYHSGASLSRTNTFRTYQLSLEKRLPFGHLQLGRFYDRLVAAGGYWDGLSFLYGSRKKGVGVSLGFMPDRSNEGFSTQFPRFSGFAHYETSRQRSSARYRIAASYHEVQPNNQYQNHSYAGLEQELDLGPLSLSQDVQLDRDPATGGWIASLFQARTRLAITTWLNVRGRFTSRQPYRMYNLISPLSIRRAYIQGGLHARFQGAGIGADYSVRYTQGMYESRTYVAYFNTPAFTSAQIAFFGSGSHWESDFGTALYVHGGLSKSINAYLFRFDYGFYRSTNNNQIDAIDQHRFAFSATLPFSKMFYLNLRGSLQQSRNLSSLAMNTSLQYRF